MSVEKRAHDRYDVELEVSIVRGGDELDARSINLSRGGLLLHAPMQPALRIGDRVRVSFSVPDLEAPIGCDAAVRWTSRVDPAVVGVQFSSGMRAKEVWALGRLLERLRADAAAS